MKEKPTKTFAVLLLAVSTAVAQVPNQTVTSCGNQTETLWTLLGQGKSVIVAAKGVDCSICMGQAPSIQGFAAANPNVRIWAAMWKRYGSTANPTCATVANWNSQYSWTDILTFLATPPDPWTATGIYPYYYTIRPSDSTIAYQGTSFTTASQIAAQNVLTSIAPFAAEPALIRAINGELEIPNTLGNYTAELYDLAGKPVAFSTVVSGSVSLISPHYTSKGIIFARIISSRGVQTFKLQTAYTR